MELYLDLERTYPPILRRPTYPKILEARKVIEKHVNKLLDIDIIRKIWHNEIVELTTPFLRNLHHDKLEKAKYITKMDFMEGFHQTLIKPNPMKLLIIICHIGIYEYTKMPFGIQNLAAYFQRMMDTIFQEEILEGWMVIYIDDIIIYSEQCEDHVKYIERVLSKCTPINLKISPKKCNCGQQELLALRHRLSVLSLAIYQKKVAKVLQKTVPKNIKEMP
ncbi:hypothetical protein O181_022076 [Austropuccinia psidii MF-1]|uniref:Reverse transcriptase domain-containing protein n=1 Tax=Austropuccinia psidii MF-1 TaxID=1389203 RepID=A0A9Q3CGQ2_9BASI|nr:hypothetical protein [Austropuccinia psidii MF-1]